MRDSEVSIVVDYLHCGVMGEDMTRSSKGNAYLTPASEFDLPDSKKSNQGIPNNCPLKMKLSARHIGSFINACGNCSEALIAMEAVPVKVASSSR